MTHVIPTIVPCSAEELYDHAQKIATFSKALHIDIDDGIFTQFRTWPYGEDGEYGAIDLSRLLELVISVHLMVEAPREIGRAFAEAGASCVIAHIEAFPDAKEVRSALDIWKRAGASVGLAILPDTPLPVLEPHIRSCDLVLVMASMKIGEQGAAFEDRTFDRIRELRALHKTIPLGIDIGVTEENIGKLAAAGVNVFFVGSTIAKAKNPEATYKKLKMLAQSALT